MRSLLAVLPSIDARPLPVREAQAFALAAEVGAAATRRRHTPTTPFALVRALRDLNRQGARAR